MSLTVDPRVERTRAVVLEAAAELLATDGFERVTIDAIAERSGVARSTIYRNWPDRPHLLIEAFETLCEVIDPPDSGDLSADLRGVGEVLARGLSSEAWGRSLPSLIGAASQDDELRAAQLAFNAQRRATVEAVVVRAADRGEVDPDADIELAILRFASSFFFTRLFTDLELDDDFINRVVAATVAELTR
ncbi:MAG TPA: TetR/AcrR family transcriptional regulator [Acidimicrobiales bacterium]|nr:TetR/AcrR family transcriptional regulator [Acidimicrobiales bacterium]